MRLGKKLTIFAFILLAAVFLCGQLIRIPATNPQHQGIFDKPVKAPFDVTLTDAPGIGRMHFHPKNMTDIHINFYDHVVMIDPDFEGVEIIGDTMLIKVISLESRYGNNYELRRSYREYRHDAPQAVLDSIDRLDSLMELADLTIRVGLLPSVTHLRCHGKGLRTVRPLRTDGLKIDLDFGVAHLELDAPSVDISGSNSMEADSIQSRIFLSGRVGVLNSFNLHNTLIDAQALQVRDFYLREATDSELIMGPLELLNVHTLRGTSLRLTQRPRYQRIVFLEPGRRVKNQSSVQYE
jgi:hypothetical protein